MAGRTYNAYDSGIAAISVAEQSGITYSATESDYIKLEVDPFLVPEPQPELVRTTEVGQGSAYSQPENDRIYRWPGQTFSLSGPANIQTIKRLVRRGLGGASNNVVVTATQSWDHTIDFLPSQTIVPIYSWMALSNGSLSYIYRAAINAFTISQSGSNRPTWSCEFITSHFAKVSDVSGLDIATIPAPATAQYLHGAALSLTYNDGAAVDLTTAEADRRVLELSCGFNNALTSEGFPGDPFYTTGDNSSGVIDSGLKRGDLRGIQDSLVNIKAYPETDVYREFDKMKAQTIGTNLIFRWRSENKINATEWYELAFTYAKWKYGALSLETQNAGREYIARRLPISVYAPTAVGSTDYLVTGRVRDNVATLV